MEIPSSGLSPQSVAERRRAGLANITSAKTTRSAKKIIFSNLFTYFNLIFLIISVLLISVGSPIRNFTFLPIIIANSFIGIFQELRAKRVLDRLNILSTPTAKVVREGKLIQVPITELVQDDLVFLKSGDQIVADAKIIAGEISVNESLLTGEPDEITKTKDSELMSGSFVVQGEAYAVLTRVGDDSYAAQLTIKAKAIKTEEQSEIIKGLNKFVWVAGITLVPIGATMIIQQLLSGADYPTAVIAMVAAIIGMIPEGLFLLATATLVLSATRLARSQVLLHDMKSIETLARADVLCVDKTGTITTGKMRVNEIIWLEPESKYDQILKSTVAALPEDSETMIAIKKSLKSHSAKNPKFAPTKVQTFSSKLKYSGVEFGSQTYLIGAPELVLGELSDELATKIKELSSAGLRVLIFASYPEKLENKPLRTPGTPLAIISIEDEIRASAPETFRYFKEQGVAIKVISGDSPATVSAIAKRAGIADAEKYIDLSKKPLSDLALAEAAATHTIFGRVTPADKRRLVMALQSQGHTVAMTGDGVNDVLALKDADCSIAMASGSSAAAGAAQMVLLESDFSKMPGIVYEGRRVVNNLERSGSLFIVKNLFSVTAALLTIITGIIYPLNPAQVSLVSFWAIGVPSFFLAQIPSSKLIRGNFMKNILRAALPTALVSVLLVSSALIIGRLTGVEPQLIGSICALVWSAVAITHLFRIARPYDRWSLIICLGCLAGLIGSILIAPPFFGLESGMQLREWSIVLTLGAIAGPLITIASKLISKAYHGFSHRS